MVQESGGDLLYLLGHVAWCLVQAAVVTAAVVAVMVLVFPGSRDTKERAYLATMKSDLRYLATAQEAHLADHNTYAPALDQFRPAGVFQPSSGVTIVMEQATATGWRATATHNGTPYRCAMFIGDAPRPRKNAEMGTPVCWKP